MSPTSSLIRKFNAWLSKEQPRLILGSSSRSRRLIMTQLLDTHSYVIRTADIDEKAIRRPDPSDMVLVLAHAKAEAIKAKMLAESEELSGFLITCDQVVVHEGKVLEKPESIEEARSHISGYGHSPAATVGSVLCTNLSTGQAFDAVDTCYVHFKPFPEHVVEQILKEGDCMHCAGSFMVEGPLFAPQVLSIEGTTEGVMGISKVLVMQLLLKAAGQQVDEGEQ